MTTSQAVKQPQTVIVWSHRGFVVQWAQGPDFREGPMVGIEDDFPFRGGLGLGLWHAAIVDAMHWCYEPETPPPKGWRLATPAEIASRVFPEDLPDDD